MSHSAEQILATIPLFSQMDAQERAEVFSIMTERSFAPGQVVMREGDASNAFYIIQRGEAEIWLTDADGKKVILDVLGSGKFFGELSMLTGETRSASVCSQEELVTLELDRDEFFAFLRRRPEAALDVLQELGQRLKHTDDLLRTRVGRNPNETDQERLSIGQRVADGIATFSGSIPFLLINLVVFTLWIGVNTIGPDTWHFDPYPFQFLTMAVSLEAIFLSIFVLISQNRQGAKDRLKTDMDYQVDVQTGLELRMQTAKLHDIEQSLQHIQTALYDMQPHS